MSKTYLNKAIFINEYCAGMELAVVLFPIQYGTNKALYFMKFKGLRGDLLFHNDEFIIFYQDEKFIPELDQYDLFDRKLRVSSVELINDLVSKCFELSSETNFPITLDGGKKGNIILLWSNGSTVHTLKDVVERHDAQ